ncbi:MAG: zinc-ribbon domain-containing protein [Candidatus Methanomethylophilaceae archaeon]|jgi:hypothetical protein
MPGFCTKCGRSLPEGARFCANCGFPVTNSPQQTFSYASQPQSRDISVETIFSSTCNELSDLFSYGRCGKEFTGDLGYIMNRVRAGISSVPIEVRQGIAEKKMAEIRPLVPEFSKTLNDETWKKVNLFMKNGVPVAITAYFFDERFGMETGSMMQRMRELSDLKWDGASFFGKATVPSAKFEDIFVLRYVMRNLRF